MRSRPGPDPCRASLALIAAYLPARRNRPAGKTFGPKRPVVFVIHPLTRFACTAATDACLPRGIVRRLMLHEAQRRNQLLDACDVGESDGPFRPRSRGPRAELTPREREIM